MNTSKLEPDDGIHWQMWWRNSIAKLLILMNWKDIRKIHRKYNPSRKFDAEGWNRFVSSEELWHLVHDGIFFMSLEGRTEIADHNLPFEEMSLCIEGRYLDVFCVPVIPYGPSPKTRPYVDAMRKAEGILNEDVRVNQPATREIIKALVKMFFARVYKDMPFSFLYLNCRYRINEKLEYELVREEGKG